MCSGRGPCTAPTSSSHGCPVPIGSYAACSALLWVHRVLWHSTRVRPWRAGCACTDTAMALKEFLNVSMKSLRRGHVTHALPHRRWQKDSGFPTVPRGRSQTARALRAAALGSFPCRKHPAADVRGAQPTGSGRHGSASSPSLQPRCVSANLGCTAAAPFVEAGGKLPRESHSG